MVLLTRLSVVLLAETGSRLLGERRTLEVNLLVLHLSVDRGNSGSNLRDESERVIARASPTLEYVVVINVLLQRRFVDELNFWYRFRWQPRLYYLKSRIQYPRHL